MTHCWEGEEDHIPEEERITRVSAAYFGDDVDPFGICMLLDGHAGPHEWTDLNDITVQFKEPPHGA